MTSSTASAICDALLEVAADSTQHRRLYLRDNFGVSTGEVFSELEPLLNEVATVGTAASGGARQIAAIRRGPVLLIPYLVDEANQRPQATWNRGLRGFAGKLRTDFSQAAELGDVYVLLILDPDPFETVLTAAEDAATLTELSWASLVTRIGNACAGPAANVVRDVTEDLIAREPKDPRALLDAFAAFAASDWTSVQEAGMALPSLGCYIADPRPSKDRLERGARWRHDLERWALPDRDLATELARHAGEDYQGNSKVTAARGPSGLDYSRFTLDDLPPAKQSGRIAIVEPPRVHGARAVASAAGVAAIWISAEAAGFSLSVIGNVGKARPAARWHDGTKLPCEIDTGRMLLHVPVPGIGEEGWWFSTITVRPGSSVTIAVYRREAEWFPIEEALQIDPVLGCFRALDSPNILAIGPGGSILGPAPLRLPSEDSEELQTVIAVHGGTEGSLPLILQSTRTPAGGEDGRDPAKGPGTGEDIEDPGEGWDDDNLGGLGGTDVPPTNGSYPQVPSAIHAQLDLAARRKRDGLPIPSGYPSLVRGTGEAGKLSFQVEGSVRYDLEPQELSGSLRGLAVEGDILRVGRSSRALAFVQVSGEHGNPEILPDPTLDRLSLEGLDGVLVDQFFDARRTLFQALNESGTVHALLCGTALDEAAAYVSAYRDLIYSIEIPGRYTPELDRLLLVDLVSIDATQCWLAPTNPVTVAWALQMAREATRLTVGGDLPARDLKALSPRALLPLLHAQGGWWEVDDRSPLLWRRYRPLGSALALGGSNPQTITRRIGKFLEVFPAYNDPRQELAVAFREPGDGGAVAAALRAFYGAELAPGAERFRPGLSVTVYTDDGEVPRELLNLMAPDNDHDLDRLIRSRVKLTTEYSDDSSDPAFAHLCFAFRSSASREPRPIRLDERAPTDWVRGLASAGGRTSSQNPNELSFANGLFIAPSAAGTIPELLRRTLEMVGGQPRGWMQTGITQATTTAISAGTLDRIQRNSVWTVHADRLLGLEAFSPDLIERKVYIVDFEDRTSVWQAGLDSITVTELIDPYRTALSRAIAPVTRLDQSALPRLIDSANAVSGSWNLDLLNLPINGLRERLGFLAAIAALRDLDGAFQTPPAGSSDLGGVLLPLDELFRLLPASGIRRPSGRSCDDLLYLRLHLADGKARIGGRLIEVKFTSTGQPDLGVARRELQRTREWLESVSNARTVARPFRSRDLSEFIRSGAIRNRSFGLGNLAQEQIEEVAKIVGRGDYAINFSYAVDGEELHGDVISLELENPFSANRTVLPGEGSRLGYVRLGAPVLESLAKGRKLSPHPGWDKVNFQPRTHQGGELTASGRVGATIPKPNDSRTPATDLTARPANPAQQSARPRAEIAPGGKTEEVVSKARELDAAVTKYGLQLAPFDTSLAQVGPSVIRYRTKPLGKENLANVRKRALDIGREVGFAEGVLIDQEPYWLTVDVPRAERVIVNLSDHLNALTTVEGPGALPFLLGMAPSGEVRVADLARLPHLLVAGATGSGKSVLLRGLLCCLARVRTPMQLQILVIDPKQVDFLPFQDLIHLAEEGIVTDPIRAVGVLKETLEREVRWRQEKLGAAGVTSALEFYEAGGSLNELPQIVILVDEFADLAASLDRAARESFLRLIQRFGQLTRAFGIYLVLATQRPSVQVITGDIKANLTARVALKVQSATDSTTILGRGGAESLRDRGDLIFDHGGRSERLQGFYAGPADVQSAKSVWVAGEE
ncbi:FtsK/SpoIIIE family protein [Actinomadura madurae]|uniref:FtsK/SpoIIIE family protein n=1 Tax=Actinomadura madurae TaxID=1993 RepID=A0A1I5VCM7_9ACTN|nr:FtsK/SpoIIIE domain-containing protein [Actinomadura madurae]SFQ05107.1 FtsK/SpoIIIE family protein [Actinomadura madurae]